MITVTRAQLAKAMPNADNLTILAFEDLFAKFPTATGAIVATTQALNDATVLTLSNNDTLANERVLALDPDQFTVTDTGPGGALVVALLAAITATYGFQLAFNLGSDTYLDLPPSGRVAERTLGGAAYANDSAAAAAGVAVGEIYRQTGGAVAWRQT